MGGMPRLLLLALVAAGIPNMGAYAPSLAMRPVREMAACGGLSAHMCDASVHSPKDRRAALHAAGRGTLAILLGSSGIQGVNAKDSQLLQRLESEMVGAACENCPGQDRCVRVRACGCLCVVGRDKFDPNRGIIFK